MVARFVLGAVLAVSVAAPAMAGPMTADEVRKFVAGKVFAFTCFDGTRGAGRVLDDGGAIGAVVAMADGGLLLPILGGIGYTGPFAVMKYGTPSAFEANFTCGLFGGNGLVPPVAGWA